MSDYQIQEKSGTLRSGFFDRSAFRKKGRSVLVLRTAVAGLCFHVDDNSEEGRGLLESLKPGTELRLFREPDNEHDEWAIAVSTFDNRELGYVTRFKNETIARLMDCGKVFHAYVDEPPAPAGNARGARDPGERRAATEDYRLPFSIYMEDQEI